VLAILKCGAIGGGWLRKLGKFSCAREQLVRAFAALLHPVGQIRLNASFGKGYKRLRYLYKSVHNRLLLLY
jgi:hypothetical protein